MTTKSIYSWYHLRSVNSWECRETFIKLIEFQGRDLASSWSCKAWGGASTPCWTGAVLKITSAICHQHENHQVSSCRHLSDFVFKAQQIQNVPAKKKQASVYASNHLAWHTPQQVSQFFSFFHFQSFGYACHIMLSADTGSWTVIIQHLWCEGHT